MLVASTSPFVRYARLVGIERVRDAWMPLPDRRALPHFWKFAGLWHVAMRHRKGGQTFGIVGSGATESAAWQNLRNRYCADIAGGLLP